MTTVPQIFDRTVRRSLAGLWLGSLLGVAGVVAALGWFLRSEARQQLLARDAELLSALAALQPESDAEDPALAVPELAFYDWAIAASELRGVLAVVLHDASGAVVEAVPLEFSAENLAAEPLANPERTTPSARFHPAVRWSQMFADVAPEAGSETLPVVEVRVPLGEAADGAGAIARFWLEGESMQREFAALDRNVALQGGVAWLVFACFLTAAWLLASRYLGRAGRALEARTAELEATNRELEMAARTAAIGSISAHLLHGLKNPLAGLRAYLRAHGDEEAQAAAQRMQRLVQETMGVLRSEARPGADDVTWTELKTLLAARLAAHPEFPPPEVAWPEDSNSRALPRREANLLLLVLENLVVNAMEAAAPAPARLTLSTLGKRASPGLRVSDRSGGLPEKLRKRLFEPGASSKPEGSGLGLAISRQLARSWGGDLVLASSGPQGCTFELSLPPATPVVTPPIVARS